MKKSPLYFQLISIMICFFVMGAIEMVGIASNYIKTSLHTSDTKANLLPFLVYIWFFICTIPVGMIMDKIGRKQTAKLSMLFMCLSMVIALVGTSYSFMVASFILLGIGSVSLQAAMYPLVSHITDNNRLPRTLTIGQLIKTLSSFSAPYITMIGSIYLFHFFNLGWRIVFLFYLIITFLAIIFLSVSKIPNIKDNESEFTLKQCFLLLKNNIVLLSFIAVMCHVGIDISTNTVSPKILMDRLNLPLDKASFGASLYFIARLTGCLIWAFLIKYVPKRVFFFISIILIVGSIIGLFLAHTQWLIYTLICCIGLGNSNLFPVIFSHTTINMPQRKDIISELMIMGQAGGALFPLLMGVLYDHVGLEGSLSVLLIGALYLIFYSTRIRNVKS